jgi:hypothetical protein
MTMPGKKGIALGAALVLLLALVGSAGAEALHPEKNQSVPDAEKLDALLTAWENTYLNEQWVNNWAARQPPARLPRADDITLEAALRLAVDIALRMELISVDGLFYYTPNLGYYAGIDGRKSYWAVSLDPPDWMFNARVYECLYIELDAVTGECLYLLIGANG